MWWDTHKDIHTNSEGETYTADESTTETAEEFMDIIRNLSSLSGIVVEMCGSWLWISGNTFPVKEQLKEFGCQWSKGKKKWYWTAQKCFTKPHYKTPSMNEIRFRYGSKNVSLSKQAMLA